jgi:hypothetical protein
MSVKISEEVTWRANRWVTFKLYRDCLQFTSVSPELDKEIVFLEKVSIDLLNLTDLQVPERKNFIEIVDKVIDYNQKTKGSDMADASGFEGYFNKLLELKQMLQRS